MRQPAESAYDGFTHAKERCEVAVMAPLKIAVSIRSLRAPLREALVQAARIGARGVQLVPRGEVAPENLSDTGRRALRRFLEGLDLKVASVELPTRRGYNVAERLEERIAATKRALTLSYQLRAPIVTNGLGPLAEDPQDPGRILQAEAMREIGQFAEHVGAVFAITPGSEPPAPLRQFLESFDSAGLGVNYDPASVLLAGFDAVEGVRELGPWIRHTDARDAVPGTRSRRGQEVALGRGSLDWLEYLGALEEFDYRGWFVIQPSSADDPLAEAANAVKFLQSF